MIDDHPHPVWNHPIFKSTDFKNYKEALQQAMSTTINPLTSTIQSLMPELCRQITTRDQELNAKVVSIVRSSADLVCKKIEDNHNSSIVHMHRIRDAVANLLRNSANQVESVDQESRQEELPESAAINNVGLPLSVQPTATVTDQDMPSFEFVVSEAISSVQELLTEWDEGIQGRPSIASIEAKWKNNCRKNTKHQKSFSRILLIMKMIGKVAARKNIPKLQAASLIEEKRNEKRLSIAKLADKWKEVEASILT